MPRRTMIRYVAVAQPYPGKSSEMADAHSMPDAHLRLQAAAMPRPLAASLVAEPVSLSQILMRLKLGHSSSQLFDPLL